MPQPLTTQPLWTPSAARVKAAAMTRFREAVAAHIGEALPDSAALHRWSVTQPETFWRFYADFARLPISSAERIRSDDAMPHTRWFDGATLNYAEALLYPPDLAGDTTPAIIAVTETGSERGLSYAELRTLVARCAASLRRAGVGQKDRVAGYLCNTPEAVVLLLACASVGAVYSSCSPDFGFDAAYARFGQIKPKLLVAADGYVYGGKRFETRPTIMRLLREIRSVEQLVLVPADVPSDVSFDTPSGDGAGREGDTLWEVWLEPQGVPVFTQLPFDHPLYILYSSGTTGLPKAMVHRAGGALLVHHREHHLHSDIRPGDVVMYFTTCGWMMWNWLVSALAQAATLVLYEGSPSHPSLETLWRLADRLGVTHFGTSARFIHGCKATGLTPRTFTKLGALRTVLSTGSPLSEAGFRWVYESVKADVHLASISGGTDIVSCFLAGDPTASVYAGELQMPGLGVDVAVFNDQGEAVVAEPGELVCRQPLPSMPLSFWNDPDFARYHDAYFGYYPHHSEHHPKHHPDVWRHGDLVAQTATGFVIYGRSDATLNPGGVRIGTAEIYRPLEALPDIVESLAVGKREGDDEVIWLFVVLAAGVTLDDGLREHIRATLRAAASPRHVPKRIFQIPELPRTRSGKMVEMAVSRLVNGQDIPNRDVIANPGALEAITHATRT